VAFGRRRPAQGAHRDVAPINPKGEPHMSEIVLLVESITTAGWVFLVTLSGLALGLTWVDRNRVYKSDVEEPAKTESHHAA
jgi:hypothetical protein